MKNEIKIHVGAKIPLDFQTSNPSAFLLNDILFFVIPDCQSEEEAKAFKDTPIHCTLCEFQSVLTFVFQVEDLSLNAEIPYSINFTPDAHKPVCINRIIVVFSDQKQIVKAMRATSIHEEARIKLEQLFEKQRNEGTKNWDEYMKIVNSLYTIYPKPGDLLLLKVLSIPF